MAGTWDADQAVSLRGRCLAGLFQNRLNLAAQFRDLAGDEFQPKLDSHNHFLLLLSERLGVWDETSAVKTSRKLSAEVSSVVSTYRAMPCKLRLYSDIAGHHHPGQLSLRGSSPKMPARSDAQLSARISGPRYVRKTPSSFVPKQFSQRIVGNSIVSASVRLHNFLQWRTKIVRYSLNSHSFSASVTWRVEER
jgi:hypothetical protein